MSTTSTTTSSSTSTSSSSTTTTVTAIPLTKAYLGDLQLPDVVIANEFGQEVVFSDFDRALDGSPVIWEQSIISGKSLDLIGGVNFGWITREDLLSLKVLAEVSGASYTLIYGGEEKTVRFRNENPPVITAVQTVPRVNPETTDWYHSLRIKLSVV